MAMAMLGDVCSLLLLLLGTLMRAKTHNAPKLPPALLGALKICNPLATPGIVVGAVHGRRGTRAAARGAPGAAW